MAIFNGYVSLPEGNWLYMVIYSQISPICENFLIGMCLEPTKRYVFFKNNQQLRGYNGNRTGPLESIIGDVGLSQHGGYQNTDGGLQRSSNGDIT
jgi:hypothetical protein